MTRNVDRGRRRLLACLAVAAVGGATGCAGDGSGTSENGGETSEPGTGTETANSEASTTGRSPEEVVREVLKATAAGDRETVRRLTVEEYSLELVGEVDDLTIESVQRLSAEEYAEREEVSVSAVEEALRQAENRGYDDATIVSYTASTAEYDNIQRDFILVLDGDQWLMYDFGKLPD